MQTTFRGTIMSQGWVYFKVGRMPVKSDECPISKCMI